MAATRQDAAIMECFPACVTCTGLCKREVPVPGFGVNFPEVPKRKTVYRYPVEPYIKLECGHFTDGVEQNVMRLLDSKHMLKVPRRGKGESLWCGKCQAWVKKFKQERAVLPEEPLY